MKIVGFNKTSGILSWKPTCFPLCEQLYEVKITPSPPSGECSTGVCSTNATWIQITNLNKTINHIVTVQAINYCGSRSNTSTVLIVNHFSPSSKRQNQ